MIYLNLSVEFGMVDAIVRYVICILWHAANKKMIPISITYSDFGVNIGIHSSNVGYLIAHSYHNNSQFINSLFISNYIVFWAACIFSVLAMIINQNEVWFETETKEFGAEFIHIFRLSVTTLKKEIFNEQNK